MYIMSFDYGKKRIGIAIGQNITATASPLEIVTTKNNKINWSRIDFLIKEWQPKEFVIGLPKYADGSDNPVTIAVKNFIKKLSARYQLPVHTIDETLSSVAAAERTKSNNLLDAVAAQIILETWFSECQ